MPGLFANLGTVMNSNGSFGLAFVIKRSVSNALGVLKSGFLITKFKPPSFIVQSAVALRSTVHFIQFQGRYLFSGLLPMQFSPTRYGENYIGHQQDNFFECCIEDRGERHHRHSLAVDEFHHFVYPETSQLPLKH